MHLDAGCGEKSCLMIDMGGKTAVSSGPDQQDAHGVCSVDVDGAGDDDEGNEDDEDGEVSDADV